MLLLCEVSKQYIPGIAIDIMNIRSTVLHKPIPLYGGTT